MEKIIVEKATDEKLNDLGIQNWSPWECEPSTFDWEYAEKEKAYVKEGRVRVETSDETVEFGTGDIVTFPKGLKCKWHVLETIRKVYTFE